MADEVGMGAVDTEEAVVSRYSGSVHSMNLAQDILGRDLEMSLLKLLTENA